MKEENSKMEHQFKFRRKKDSISKVDPPKTAHSNINFRKIFAGKKMPLVILDERWLALFSEKDLTEHMVELSEIIRSLLKQQGKIIDKMKGYKRYKSQLMQEIVTNMETDNSPLGRLKIRKLEKNQKLILSMNEKLSSLENELESIPYEIRDINEQLMGESAQLCYEQMVEAHIKKDKLTADIEQLEKRLANAKKRKEELEKRERETYTYLHDILGVENMRMIDENLDTISKRRLK